jgi:predicted nucleotidyltransferase/DNA-binding transcriptional ArsR family regulator
MSTTHTTLDHPAEPGALLFGKTRRQLLAWLYGHPDERFYLRQLVRQTGAAQGAVQRELQSLYGAALVTRTVDGRQVYFQANRESPVFTELRQLLLKTAGAVEIIRQTLAPIAPSIQIAFIYGSAAKGTVRASSDIDLLLVGDASFSEVVSALADAQHRLGRDVNPTVYPVDEFNKKVRAGHHFLTTVLRESKVFIIGSEHELGRLAEKRVVDPAPDQRPRSRRPARRRRS